MDFSGSAFRHPQPTSTLSGDTMSHANMVMACRWGWSSSSPSTPGEQAPSPQPPIANFSTSLRAQRFAPCRGRLYHQLLCAHKIRTDLVEDCGPNCLEPYSTTTDVPFWCQQCVEQEAGKIWEARKAQLNANYPPLDQMMKEQYDEWYELHRQMEIEFNSDRRIYELEKKSTTRPSNVCSALEVSKEEMDFAAELDSLSLSLMSSNDGAVDLVQPEGHARNRISLPNDMSEQLHWDLNSLALDRGSCGVEYTSPQAGNGIQTMRPLSEDELWRKPRQ